MAIRFCLYTGHILHRVRDKISLDRSLRGRRFSRVSIHPMSHRRRSLRLQQKNTNYSKDDRFKIILLNIILFIIYIF